MKDGLIQPADVLCEDRGGRSDHNVEVNQDRRKERRSV